MKKITLLIIALGLGHLAGAQNLFNHDEDHNTVYSRIGIEPTTVLTAGYMYPIDGIVGKRNVLLYGEVSSPIHIGISNYELRAGGIIEVLRMKKFGITYNLNFSTGHVETQNFNSQKFALYNKLSLGYFHDIWYWGIVGEYERIFANKITHTQYYKDHVFPEAYDGWYKGAGGSIQLGLELGFTFRNSIDVIVDLKVPRSEKFNSYNGSPGHINVTVGYRF